MISVAVEEFFEELENSDPLRLAVALDDLELLSSMGFVEAQLHSMFGQWMHITGPSGRVSYWLSPDSDEDVWWIESLDVD